MSTEPEKLEYNQIKIKDLETGKYTTYTLKESSWLDDNKLELKHLNADHKSVNQLELWISRLKLATGLPDAEIRGMSRRVFETLIIKWLQVNDADKRPFLEDGSQVENQ